MKNPSERSEITEKLITCDDNKIIADVDNVWGLKWEEDPRCTRYFYFEFSGYQWCTPFIFEDKKLTLLGNS